MKMIGMIGLGIMGGAMARNLRAADFQVIGFDLDANATAAAKSEGVTIVDSAEAVAARAEITIISLPSAKGVIETAKRIAATKCSSRTIIETSTLALADKTAFADIITAAGHTPLDCPLSGTGAQAQTKDLVVFASGDTVAIKSCDAVFQGFARKVFDLGAFGNGSKMKFVANLLVAIHNVASAEAMVLGMKAGLDPKQIVEVVSSGAGNSRVLELRGPMMAANSYLPATMRLRTWKKDMTVIGEFASAYDCPTPLFKVTEGIYDAALSQGRDGEDAAAVCSVLEMMAGLTR